MHYLALVPQLKITAAKMIDINPALISMVIIYFTNITIVHFKVALFLNVTLFYR